MKRYGWLLLLFMASPGKTEVISQDMKTQDFADFSGGLNTAVARIKVPLTMSPNIRNLLIDEKPGSLVKRKGFIVAGSSRTLMGIRGIFPFYKEDGTTKFLVTDSSIVLQTQDFNQWVLVSSGQSSSVLTRCVQVRNKMWCTNGVDPVFTWDDVTKVVLNGQSGTPNVPRFKFPILYQERVFGLNTSGAGSSLDYNAIISTDNRILAPDDFLAWPAQNRIFIGQGDGQVGNGMWIQNGLLYVGKQNSIYSIYGTEPYVPKKVDAQVGMASPDSVVILDNNANFLGQDGIYENLRRISDAFAPDLNNFQTDTTQLKDNTWDTFKQFSQGPLLSGTTVTQDGFVLPNSSDVIMIQNISVGVSPTETSSMTFGGNVTTSPVLLWNTTPTALSPDYLGYLGAGQTEFSGLFNNVALVTNLQNNGSCPEGGSPITPILKVHLTNKRTGQTLIGTGGSSGSNGTWALQSLQIGVGTGTVFWTGDDVLHSNFLYRIFVTTTQQCNNGMSFGVKFATEAGVVILTPSTTGQFISDVATISMVTAWSAFNSVNNTNGGAISYFTRTSTSAVNITTQTWAPIAPGAIVSAPNINNFLQWAATVASVSPSQPLLSNIDNVTISHVEGSGSSDRAFGIDWKNRYWLSVATETTGNFSLIYVRARGTSPSKDAFVLFDGINIRAFGKDRSNTLYGGAASTGTIYRLDFGTNDNGKAITSIYEFPDLSLDNNWKKKYLRKVFVEGEKESGALLNIGLAVDESDYTDSAISIDGSGSYFAVLEGISSYYGKILGLRLKNNQLDKGMTIDTVSILYQPSEVYK